MGGYQEHGGHHWQGGTAWKRKHAQWFNIGGVHVCLYLQLFQAMLTLTERNCVISKNIKQILSSQPSLSSSNIIGTYEF